MIRPEENAVLIWVLKTGKTAYLSGDELDALEAWCTEGSVSGFIRRLIQKGIISEGDKEETEKAIVQARTMKAPSGSFYAPESLHIELTTRCHLQCPQCYKAGAEEEDLPYKKLCSLLDQAAQMKVFQIALGGGEPLLYPQIYETVEKIHSLGMACSITTGGADLDRIQLDHLIQAGVSHIQVSLNGAIEEVNRYSREGYTQAVEALWMLSESGLSFGINMVVRKDNLYHLPEMFQFVRQMKASNINILRCKPSVAEHYDSVSLSKEEQLYLKQVIQDNRELPVKVDSAFSNLLCSLNGKPGLLSGCGAGRRFLAVDAHGFFRPCSHMPMREQAEDLFTYWRDSVHLNLLRIVEERVQNPCKSCRYLSGCRGCRAIAMHTKKDFFAGDSLCAFYQE